MKKHLGRHASWAIGVFTITLLGGSAWMPEPAFSAWTIGKPIVTYYAGPGGEATLTDANAKQLAEGGWNLVWAKSLTELDAAQAHGLRAMWTGSLDMAMVNAIKKHPALYAYHVTDEPSSTRFPELAATVANLRTLDPNRMAYINLFPNNALDTWYGTDDKPINYPTYLSQYISIVKPSLLSYDHYQFIANGSDEPNYFKNLAIISHTAKQAGIPFINVVQSSSWDASMRVPNGNELRYLYNTSLAYGAQAISCFVYYHPGINGGMALADGTTTPLYDTAKTINPQFLAMAEQVQSLKHIGAYHLGDLPWGWDTTDGSSPMRLPSNAPFALSPTISNTDYVVNQPVKGALLGLFGPDAQLANATHAIVVNLDYSNAIKTRVTGPGDLSVFDPATGEWIAQGHPWADVSLLPGGSAW